MEEIMKNVMKDAEIIKNGNNIVLVNYYGAVENVVVPNEVTKIGNGAFATNPRVKSVEIGDGVTDVGYMAFENCHHLKEVKFGKNIKVIECFALKNCYALEEISIPNSVTDIESSAFLYCKNLKHINLGDKLENVESNAFVGCDSLDKETWLKLIAINPEIIVESMPLFYRGDKEFMKQCRATALKTLLTWDDSNYHRALAEEIDAWTTIKLSYQEHLERNLKDK